MRSHMCTRDVQETRAHPRIIYDVAMHCDSGSPTRAAFQNNPSEISTKNLLIMIREFTERTYLLGNCAAFYESELFATSALYPCI